MSYYDSRRTPTVAEARWMNENRAALRAAETREYEALRAERNSARGGWDKATEMATAMGFPKETLVHVLGKSEGGEDTAMNVEFSYDRAEAAAFIQEDLTEIDLRWSGTENERTFVHDFVRTYLGAKPEDCAWDPFGR